MVVTIIWSVVALIVGLIGGFFLGIFTFRKQLEKMQNDPDMMAKMTQDPEMMKRVAKQMGLNQQQVNRVQQMMKGRSRKKK
jgi:uncharacterized protein YneF (UPF0154 family)